MIIFSYQAYYNFIALLVDKAKQITLKVYDHFIPLFFDKSKQTTPTKAQISDFFSVLHSKSSAEAFSLLHAKGLNVNTQITHGLTLLHIAAQRGDAYAITVLCQAGANFNIALSWGSTPLHVAAQYGHPGAITALYQAGANVNTILPDGGAAVHLAVLYGHANVIPALYKAGADLNIALPDGSTPLHVAALYGDVNVITALCQARARVEARNNQDFTALHVASRDGHANVVAALLKARANPDLQVKGQTAVEIAENALKKDPEKYTAVIEVFKANLLALAWQAQEMAKKEKQARALKQAQAKKQELNRLRQEKNLFFEVLSVNKRRLEAIKAETKTWANKRKILQADIFANIIVMTDKLAEALQGSKNKGRLRGLEKNLSSLEDWKTGDDEIKIEGKKLQGIIRDFSVLLSFLQQTLPRGENLGLQQRRAVFSEVAEALAGEITVSKSEVLKAAGLQLQAEWPFVIDQQKAFLERIKKLETLAQALSERMEQVKGLRLGSNNGDLRTLDLDRIREKVISIQTIIATHNAANVAPEAAQTLIRSKKPVS